MADKSTIEWTEATWNPVTGCSKVSPGCDNCYAETLTERYAGTPGWIAEHRPWSIENAEHNAVLHPERLDVPLRWRRSRMVFVNSMSDLFHEEIPDYYIDRVFAAMALASRHTFQILTKRPQRAAAWFAGEVPRCSREERIDEACGDPPFDWGEAWPGQRPFQAWPLPNVWLGVSIESWRFNWRADVLRRIPAAVRFISAEPLLDTLYPGTERDLDLTGIDWVIVGGESGNGFRPMNLDHAREIREACASDDWCDCFIPTLEGAGQHSPGCRVFSRPAFFFKQVGGRTPKAGGRLLDGREWNEMPQRQAVPA